MKNHMKKVRKRIFGVVFTLIAVFSVFAFLNSHSVHIVKAEEEKLPTCVDSTFHLEADFADSMSITPNGSRTVYWIKSAHGTFKLKSVGQMGTMSSDGWYSTTSSQPDWVTTWRPNDKGKEVAKTNVSPSKILYVTINSEKVTNPPQNVVLTFEFSSVKNCIMPAGHTIELQVVLPMDNVVQKFAGSSRKFNSNKYITTDDEEKSGVKKLCNVLKEKVTLDDIKAQNEPGSKNEIKQEDLDLFDEDLIDTVYKYAFPYCWDKAVAKNKKAATVRKKIKKALEEGAKYLKEEELTYTDSFNYAFNRIKYRAGGKINENGTESEIACATELKPGQLKDHCFDLNEDSSLKGKKSDPITLQCKEDTTSNYRTEEGYNFENSSVYYAFKKYDGITANYTYYRTGSTWDEELDRTTRDNGTVDYKDKKTVCSKLCEEAIEVEYGPPVVAKAGRCFEYRVRVTSRIKCETEVIPNTGPSVDPVVCSPAPVCIHTGQKGYMTGAGPTEEFDECIQKCDGGKYTQECSKKCYNESYQSNVSKLAVNYDQKVVKLGAGDSRGKLITKADFKSDTYAGTKMNGNEDAVYEDQWNLEEAYYSSNGSTIAYHYGLALWYYFNNRTQMEARFAANMEAYWNYAFYEHEGFGRMVHDGIICGANCKYISCGVGYYNEEDAVADREDNVEEYFNKLRLCKAQSTCTTKDASFSMSTQYNDKTILYPGPTTNNENSVHSKETSEPEQVPTLKYCEKGQTGGTCADNSVIYDYNGCYKTSENKTDENGNQFADKFYQTEITYPGTWINDKRQEISYEKPQSTTGWTLENQQFCLPTNAQDVNRKWWLWYMQQISRRYHYNFDDEYGQKCLREAYSSLPRLPYSSEEEDTPDLHDTDNILAYINKFGHFGWYFKVQCFYALNSDPSQNTTNDNDDDGGSSKTNEKCDTNPYNYRVRSVDLSNLFPGKDGTATRTPGFNWTSAARLTKAETVNGTSYYNVNPAKVATTIQQRGDSIFDDDNYMDYWFHLDSTALKLLRNYNKQRNGYNDFSGDFYTDTDTYGFTRYKSNLFNYSGGSADSGNNILGNVNGDYVKAVGNLLCNNDGFGDACETFQ